MTISARRLLSALLLVQLAGAAIIAAMALRWFGAAPAKAIACGLGAVVLVRLLVFSNNFVLSARHATPMPPEFRIGTFAWLRLFAEEFAASMLQSSWDMPRAAPRQVVHPAAAAPPVLLLHGYGCNSGYWNHLARMLDAARISHATLDLEPVTAGIDDYVPLVERAAASLLAATGAPAVVIVAHSMGGLVARAWMRAYGTARVARVITLGTPHHGTCLASFGVGLNAAQMQRAAGCGEESAWLRELGASESAATRALVTSIYTHHDNIVSPQVSGMLEGARNIAIGGVGHVALGRNPAVLARVVQEIAKC